MPRHRALVSPILGTLLIAITGETSAFAEPPAPAGSPTPGEAAADDTAKVDKRAEAAARFSKGRALIQKGAWAAAFAEFIQSRQLYPTWSATSNAAFCLQQLQRYDESLDLFEALLREFSDRLPADVKAAAQRTVVELRGLVGTIDIEEAEPGAAITIDGLNRGDYPLVAPLRVAAGSHVVRVYKEGFEPFETRIEVAGGQTAHPRARLRELARKKLTVQVRQRF